MKMFDEDALALVDAVRDVIEGRIKKEVAEPEAKGEKDFKDAHTIDKEDDVEEAAVKVIPEKLPSMNRDEKDIADTLTKAGLVYGKVNKFDSGKFIDPKTGVSITIMRNGNAVAASSADGGTLLSPTDPSNLQAFLKKRGLIESPAIEEALSPADKEKRLKMIRQAVEKINKNNAELAKKDALRMMKDSGMFDD